MRDRPLRSSAISLLLLSFLIVLPVDPPTLAGSRRSKVKEFSADGLIDVGIDQSLTFRFRGRVKKKWVSPEWIRIHTADGVAARGSFFRGDFLLDPDSGTHVVVDPEQIGPLLLPRIERRGRPDLIPRSIRYDLGGTSDLNGNRQLLHDLTERKTVTFVADVPNRADLTDAAFAPGTTYFVEVGRPGKKPWFTSSFTTAAADAERVFGDEIVGPFQVVNSEPANGKTGFPIDDDLYLRFSRPIDPRTLTESAITLEVASVIGSPTIPFTPTLEQTRSGAIVVRLTPDEPLPSGEYIRVTVDPVLTDLRGAPFGPWAILFSTP